MHLSDLRTVDFFTNYVEIELRICPSCKSAALRTASRLAKTRGPKCNEDILTMAKSRRFLEPILRLRGPGFF